MLNLLRLPRIHLYIDVQNIYRSRRHAADLASRKERRRSESLELFDHFVAKPADTAEVKAFWDFHAHHIFHTVDLFFLLGDVVLVFGFG